MKDLSNVASHFSGEPQSTDKIVSHMLMGFVERKISPQTIADVLRAQIFESQIPINFLDIATCNGILEAVTLANSTEDCFDLVLYLSTHPQFQENLTWKAAVGALCVLLRYAQKKIDTYQNQIYRTLNENDFIQIHLSLNDYLIELDFLKDSKNIETLINEISMYLLNFFHSKLQWIDAASKNTLFHFMEKISSTLIQLFSSCEHFQYLITLLQTKNKEKFINEVKEILPKSYDMISLLLKTTDEQMMKNGVSYYRTELNDKNSLGRVKYLKSVLESLKTTTTSDFKTTFFIEWIFDQALVEAVFNDATTFEYMHALKHIMENCGSQSSVLKGLIKSIQQDFISFKKLSHEMKSSFEKEMYFEKFHKLANLIFPYLVILAEKDLNYITKNIANWALELSLENEMDRFFKKNHWRWIRCLASKIWDASLREPPSWVVEAGNVYCATLFQHAPALWLQEYSAVLIERVYKETLVERFHPTNEHFNYVEYLIRSVRKKSPFFASRTESLVALSLLSRMTQTEALQYANAKSRFQNLLPSYTRAQIQISPEFSFWKNILEQEENFIRSLGNNPVTRALSVLLQLSKETSKKGQHFNYIWDCSKGLIGGNLT